MVRLRFFTGVLSSSVKKDNTLCRSHPFNGCCAAVLYTNA